MSALFPDKGDTLTATNIIDAYRSAYLSVNNRTPDECRYLHGRWFIINGIERDRGWVLLEIERLRQEALMKAFDTNSENHNPRMSLFKLIRRLSRL